MAMGIFLSVIMVLVIFNLGYYMVYPTTFEFIGISLLSAFIVSGLAVGVISGITVLGTGISETSQKIIYTIIILVNLLFQFTLPLGEGYEIPVGIGLLTNVYNVFAVEDMFMIGFGITSALGIMALISGLQMAVGEGDG